MGKTGGKTNESVVGLREAEFFSSLPKGAKSDKLRDLKARLNYLQTFPSGCCIYLHEVLSGGSSSGLTSPSSGLTSPLTSRSASKSDDLDDLLAYPSSSDLSDSESESPDRLPQPQAQELPVLPANLQQLSRLARLLLPAQAISIDSDGEEDEDNILEKFERLEPKNKTGKGKRRASQPVLERPAAPQPILKRPAASQVKGPTWQAVSKPAMKRPAASEGPASQPVTKPEMKRPAASDGPAAQFVRKPVMKRPASQPVSEPDAAAPPPAKKVSKKPASEPDAAAPPPAAGQPDGFFDPEQLPPDMENAVLAFTLPMLTQDDMEGLLELPYLERGKTYAALCVGDLHPSLREGINTDADRFTVKVFPCRGVQIGQVKKVGIAMIQLTE